MKLIVTFILLLNGAHAYAKSTEGDPVYNYCFTTYENYPTLMEDCLEDFEEDYVDSGFGDMCESQYQNYSTLWKDCLKENKNLAIKRGFAQYCENQYGSYFTLWKDCLRKHSRPSRGRGCE